VSVRAAPVLANLAGAVTALRPAIENLAPASGIGRTTLDELAAASPNLRATLGAVRSLSTPATKKLPALRRVLCQVNPMLRYSQPYVPDLTSMITNMEDAAQGWDSIGHLVRVSLDVSEGSLGALPPSVEAAANQLVHSGLLSVFPSYSFDPYPPPGVMKTQSALNTPHYSGRADFGAHSGYHYPRIAADC
jgi:ABC-type transporter Mla subunit MlaD